ncbi:uncharacterized protein LOC143857024 [Tasmannia lanceolata]|uniref:uncharacterized protein LOC143857024 n=1 Tax=Tasmannia lanceolata TaxID=3420 RepID=UPI004062CE02
MVLEIEDHTYTGNQMILKKWTAVNAQEKLNLTSVPVWIEFPGFPLQFWNSNGLSKIASAIGVPLDMDSQTAEETRLNFARLCVEWKMVPFSQTPFQFIPLMVSTSNMCYMNGNPQRVRIVKFSAIPPQLVSRPQVAHIRPGNLTAPYTCKKTLRVYKANKAITKPLIS